MQGYYSDNSVGGLPDDSSDVLSFTSSDESVVRVSSQGEVTGEGVGGADLEVSFGKFSATVPVMVWGEPKSIPPMDPDSLLEVDGDGSAIALNRMIVELEPGLDVDDAGQVAEALGGEIIFQFATFPGFLIEMDAGTADDLEETFRALESDQRVARAYPDLLLPSSQASSGQEIETLRIDPDYATAYLQSGMQEAWEKMASLGPVNTEPVVIVVIDSGFTEPTDEDNAINELLGREFDYQRIAIVDGIVGDNPDATHGTSVTSVMVAQNNDTDSTLPAESFSGVVTSVGSLEYYVIFYEVGEDATGGQSLSGIIYALEELYAFREIIDVVNFSTSIACSDYQVGSAANSGSGSSIDGCGWVGVLADLIGGMRDHVTFVAPAGNAGRDISAADSDAQVIPAAFSLELDNAITAAGISGFTPRGRSSGWVYDRAEDSNYGDAVTIAAPYDVWAMDIEDSDGYGQSSGTSFSVPMVSGTVALLKALDPELSPAQVKEILTATGTIIRVCDSSRNHPSDDCSGEEQEWRKLNAGAAVKELLRRSVKANIDLTLADNPSRVTLDTTVDLSIPVKNEGQYAWDFHMDASDCAPSGAGFQYQLPLRNIIQPGGTALFSLSFDATEPGSWRVDVGAFRDSAELDPQRDSALDEEELHIFVPGAAAQRSAMPTSTTEPTATGPMPTQTRGPTPTGATPFTAGVPSGAKAITCVAQEEGTAAGIARSDANVIIVADTSGSMEGEKIAKLRETAIGFYDLIDDPAEYVSLLDFDDTTKVVFDLTAKGSIGRSEWEDAVAGLDSDGGTALYDAVSHAVGMLEEVGAHDRLNLIIALTDGGDSDSHISLSEVLSQIEGASVNVTLVAIGFGDRGAYDLDVLNELAIAGSTRGAAIEEEGDIDRMFTTLSIVFSGSN